MKTWKHLAFVALLAVLGIIATFSACNNDNTKIDPKCECTETVHTDAECSCDAVGYDCTCVYEPVNNDPVLCTCVEKVHLEYYDDVCDCKGEDCACLPMVYAWFNETIPVYIMSGVVDKDTALANLNERFTQFNSDDQTIIAKNISKVIIVSGGVTNTGINEENGKYLVEIGETVSTTVIGALIFNPILNAPLISKVIPLNILKKKFIV